MTKTPASNTVKELPRYPVQNSPSGNYFWGGPAGRGGIVYNIVWRRCPRRTPWMMLRTPVCSYPIIVTHLSFNFLCLLLLYSICLNGVNCTLYSHIHGHIHTSSILLCLCQSWFIENQNIFPCLYGFRRFSKSNSSGHLRCRILGREVFGRFGSFTALSRIAGFNFLADFFQF